MSKRIVFDEEKFCYNTGEGLIINEIYVFNEYKMIELLRVYENENNNHLSPIIIKEKETSSKPLYLKTIDVNNLSFTDKFDKSKLENQYNVKTEKLFLYSPIIEKVNKTKKDSKILVKYKDGKVVFLPRKVFMKVSVTRIDGQKIRNIIYLPAISYRVYKAPNIGIIEAKETIETMERAYKNGTLKGELAEFVFSNPFIELKIKNIEEEL